MRLEVLEEEIYPIRLRWIVGAGYLAEWEEFVKRLVEEGASDPLSLAALDLLRALVILYGSGWERDIRDVLMGIWSIRDMGLEEMGELQVRIPEAVKLLSEKGVIKVERRLHAVGMEPEEEDLYTATDIVLLSKILSADREVSRYRYEMMGSWTRR